MLNRINGNPFPAALTQVETAPGVTKLPPLASPDQMQTHLPVHITFESSEGDASKPGFWSTLASKIGGALLTAKDAVIDTSGRTIGVLGLLGFRYPVREYREDVSSELTRGTRLSRAQIAALPNQGYTAVVNLCREDNTEQLFERQAGLDTLNIPILDNSNPGLDEEGFAKIDTMIAFIQQNTRTYVHCQAGKGRTGLAVACYQIAVLGKDVDEAVAEAKAKGMAMPNQEKFVRAYAEHLRGQTRYLSA